MHGKEQTLERDKDEVKIREQYRTLCNNSASDNDTPPINPSLQLQCNTWRSMDCDFRGRSCLAQCQQEWNLKKSILELG